MGDPRAGAGKVFREVASGAKANRPQLARLVSELAAGDVLMVTRLDRLARSTRDLLNTLAAISEKKAGFRSLGDAWADTTTAHGRLMLTVLGGLAEFERELIRIRTGEGRAACQGGRQEPRAQAEAHPAPERGGHSPARRGRVTPRDRAGVQCQPEYDFEAHGVTFVAQHSYSQSSLNSRINGVHALIAASAVRQHRDDAGFLYCRPMRRRLRAARRLSVRRADRARRGRPASPQAPVRPGAHACEGTRPDGFRVGCGCEGCRPPGSS
jgi:hypothetical protein